MVCGLRYSPWVSLWLETEFTSSSGPGVHQVGSPLGVTLHAGCEFNEAPIL